MLEERDAHIQSFKEVENQSVKRLSVPNALPMKQKQQHKRARCNHSKAQAEASQIVNDGIEKARRLSFQTEDMKRQSKVFRSRFRMLVEAQLDLLKSDDWEYLLNYDLDSQQVTEENFQHLNEQDITAQEKQQAEQANQQPNETSSSETDK